MGMPLVCVNRIWYEPFDSGGTWTLEYMITKNYDNMDVSWKKRKKEEMLPIHRCCQQGGKAYRASKRGTIVIYNSRIEDVWRYKVLEMLNKLYLPIAVLQFGDKH